MPPPSPASDKFKFLNKLTLSQKIFAGFAIPISLTILLAFTVYYNAQSLIETNKWVEHTHKVITQGHLLEKLILEMETGERGFLITGKDSFLTPFNKARNEWELEIEKTVNLVSDNQSQVNKIIEINKNAESWLQEDATPEINQRRKVTTPSLSIDHIETLLEKKTGKEILDSIRQTATNLDSKFKAANNQEASKLLISVLKGIVDQESSERGFLITGDESFLKPYFLGKKHTNKEIGLLKSVILNSPNKESVTTIIETIENLSAKWLNEVAIPEIDLRRQKTPNIDIQSKAPLKKTEDKTPNQLKLIEEIFSQGKGKFILDEMRRNFDKLLQTYNKSGNERAQTLVISISKSMIDQETGHRGFLITGQEPFLEPFHIGQIEFSKRLKALKEIVNNSYLPEEALADIDQLEALMSDWENNAAQKEIEDRRQINETGLSPLEQLQKLISPSEADYHTQKIVSLLNDLATLTKDTNRELTSKIRDLQANIRQQQIHFIQYLSTNQEQQLENLKLEQDKSNKLLIEIAALHKTAQPKETTYKEQEVLGNLITSISEWQRDFISLNLSQSSRIKKSRVSSLAQIQQVLKDGKGKQLLDEARAILNDINGDFIKARNIKGSHTTLSIAKYLSDQETGERGFIITGDESFLKPYHEGGKNLRLAIAELQNIANQAFNIEQSLDHLSNIEALVDIWQTKSAEPEIAIRNKVNSGEIPFREIIDTLSSGLGKSILDNIRHHQNTLNQVFFNAHNQSAQKLIAQLEKDIVDMETGQRGFLLSGKLEFLQPYNIGKESIAKHFSQLKSLIKQGYKTEDMLFKIEALRLKTQQWQIEAGEPEILLRRQLDKTGSTMADVTRLIEGEKGKHLIETIQTQIHDFIEVEQQLIDTRSYEAKKAAQLTLYQTVIGALITIIAASLTGFFLLKTILHSLLKLNMGTQQVAEGDFTQPINIESNDEIGKLANAFNQMTLNLRDSTESMKKSKLALEQQKDLLTQQKTEIEISNSDLVKVQEELKQKAEDLERSSQYKSDFLATMSHEIRTPINGVLGMLGLLMKSDMSDEQHRKAKIAYTSAQSLLNIINDILDYSKVDAGKLELEYIDFNLRSLMEELIDGMAFRAQEKGIELILDTVKVNQTMVKGDPGRIRQILTNLIGNSLKFTNKGEIVVTAILKPAEDKKLQLFCEVTDTGIGIPSDKLHRLFNTFTQVDASTTRKYGGTGLGLSIVKKLCNLMNGDIRVTSAPDQGSCFSFTIDLENSMHTISHKPIVDISTLRLLVVDDNDTNLDVISNQLQQWGAHVTQAKSAAEALAICQRRSNDYKDEEDSNWKPFDIALLDYSMPDMDGAELGQELKDNPRFSNMKLIMMTSISARGDAQYFSDLGFDAYFPKPATASDLHDALAVVANGGITLEQAQPLVTRHYVRGLTNSEEPTDRNWPISTRILLVEDNQVNQQVAKDILQDIGLDADIAGNGVEALHALNQADTADAYTLILMDCQMPEMDGYETTRNIRAGKAGDHNRDITIVAMTANAMAGDKEACLESGMNDYVSKPIDISFLESILAKWLIPHQAPDKPILEITDNDNQTQKPIWDQTAALKRINNKPERLIKLASLYIKDMPARLEELADFISNEDFKKVLHIAHTIKGVAGNLSALALQDLADQTEKAAKSENKELLVELSNSIISCHHQVVAELEKFTSAQRIL
jgi:CHASE3 domain sensor protein/DNA-binding response OmpR family regulator/nitrogen-specific signal transduction histidine kinase/HPt (histidine-containing phosphotransfer) domain-containing protein